MSCRICGSANTVTSHILPRAIAHQMRRGGPNLTGGSRFYSGRKITQSGETTKVILCEKHEAATARPDKYGVEFLRRAEALWLSRGRSSGILEVQNRTPLMLRTFALACIWREVAAQQAEGRDLTLGRYGEAVQAHLFANKPAPDWPLIIQRTNFELGADGPVDFIVHPYRIKLVERSTWTFTAAGYAFFLVNDPRGIPPIFMDWRADKFDPAPVPVGNISPFLGLRSLQPLWQNMLRPRGKPPV